MRGTTPQRYLRGYRSGDPPAPGRRPRCAGCRLTSFKVPHSRAGLRELVSRRVRREGRVHFAFEATGHVWEAVGAFLAQRALRYYVVNPLATFQVREARQMGLDKRDLTDRSRSRSCFARESSPRASSSPPTTCSYDAGLGGIPSPSPRARTTQDPAGASALRRLPGTGRRVAHGHGSGMPRGVEGGLASSTNCRPDKPDFIRVVQAHRRGRRMWRFKIEQVWEKAGGTVAAPHGHQAAAGSDPAGGAHRLRRGPARAGRGELQTFPRSVDAPRISPRFRGSGGSPSPG